MKTSKYLQDLMQVYRERYTRCLKGNSLEGTTQERKVGEGRHGRKKVWMKRIE